MNYYELPDEEQKLLDEFENGELTSAPDLEERKKLLQSYARNTLNKTKNINIRLSERDLYRLKSKAIEEGIPYQTLAASIIHKASTK
jgi:predicted DNA binding CopG/RHH family protein